MEEEEREAGGEREGERERQEVRREGLGGQNMRASRYLDIIIIKAQNIYKRKMGSSCQKRRRRGKNVECSSNKNLF